MPPVVALPKMRCANTTQELRESFEFCVLHGIFVVKYEFDDVQLSL